MARQNYLRSFSIAVSATFLLAGGALAVDSADGPSARSFNAAKSYEGEMKSHGSPATDSQTLRKLWQSEPMFSQMDGLNDYGAEKSSSDAASGPSTSEAPKTVAISGASERNSGVIDTALLGELRKWWRTGSAVGQPDGLVDYGGEKASRVSAIIGPKSTGSAPSASRRTTVARANTGRASWFTDPSLAQPDGLVDYGG